MKAVIILPTYNERENIIPLLTSIRQAVATIPNYTIEYLVVDDDSPDGTKISVTEYQKKHKNVHLITGKKEGLGKALLRGMTYAREKLDADVFVQMDADLSHSPALLPKFFAALDSGANFVVGSRYIPGGSIPDNWGFHRKIFSIVGNAIVRYGLGFLSVHDWTGGYRAFRGEFFDQIKNDMKGYGGYVFQIAFLHKALGCGARVHEVPIQFVDRRYGRSKIAPSEYIRNVFEYVFRARLAQMFAGSFGKFLVVGTIGFIINTVVLETMVNVFGAHPAAGSAFGAELAIISNFFLNNSWTFRSQKVSGHRLITKFLQFNGTSLGAILIQAGTVAIGTFFMGVSPYRFFYILGVGFGLVWNYWMYSNVIWKNTKPNR